MSKRLFAAALAVGLAAGTAVTYAEPTIEMESYRVPELFYLETQARIQEQFNLNHDRAQRFVDTVVEKARRDGIITDSYVAKLNYETTFQSETILSVRREFLVDIKTGTPHYGFRGYTYDTRIPAIMVYDELFPFDYDARMNILAQVTEAAKTWDYEPFEGRLEKIFTDPTYLPNFYVNGDGDPVLIFNPYEVAPMEMGAIEVVIKGYRVK